MKLVNPLLLLSFTILIGEAKAQLTAPNYTNHNLVGFNVLVEDTAVTANAVLVSQALDLLESNLEEILQFNISQEKIDSLVEVPIFMDWNTTNGAAQYHPSQSWLINNGYIPEKAKCVEISNVTNFVSWVNQNQPYMVLHELAHAYHHRVLNFNSPVITKAYNNAIFNSTYTNVQYHTGGGNYITQVSAYALNNENEFFAEITEAYFGLNDYYPFDYNDLLTYDITGFNAAMEVWGDITTSISSVEVQQEVMSIYPNPAQEYAMAFTAKEWSEYQLFDAMGHLAFRGTNSGSNRIDLSELSSGIYSLRLIDNQGEVSIGRLIKH
jgi:hypothetical protein